MLRSIALVAAVFLVPAAAHAGRGKSHVPETAAVKRELRRRTLKITDANVSSLPEIHVAAKDEPPSSAGS